MDEDKTEEGRSFTNMKCNFPDACRSKADGGSKAVC